jgi:hypothetical protein
MEFEAILADPTKRIEGDLRWREDEDHSPAVEFRADLQSDAGYPIVVAGRFNSLARKLSFTLIHRGTGRVYALDMGADHHNPTCHCVGEKHKHRWTEAFGDKEAYVPEDITATVDDPVAVWKQFCAEAQINHDGALAIPRAPEGFDS